MSCILGDFANKLRAFLLAASVPGLVMYGNEGFTRESEIGVPFVHVVPDPSGDTYEGLTAQQHGKGSAPTAVDRGGALAVRYVGCLITVEASSSKSGATEDDHVEACESILHSVVIATITIAHKFGLRLRLGSGEPVTPTETDAAQASAKYALHFQLGCGISQDAPKTAATAPILANTLIVNQSSNADSAEQMIPETLAMGTTASLVAVSGSLMTLGGLVSVDPSWPGYLVELSGASNPANNGKFRLKTYHSSSSVDVINPNAVYPDANSGSIVWSIVAAELAVPGVT